MDAHCEVNVNWLPPLLEPIYRDRTVMTVPIIDVIDLNNFRYHSENHNGDYRGGFDWSLLYEKHKLTAQQEKSRKYKSEPYDSPTHAGGLLAIDRNFFLRLEAYDPGLLIWGGENMELSFKIWQCGGSIKWVPCSRVGHVYRKFLPYDFGQRKKGPLDLYNYKRVVETWFDPKHKEYFYTRVPLARFLDHGDISKQLSLKKRLRCKSFQWYMENVANDIIPDLPRNMHWGELRNLGTNSCMDSTLFGPPSLMKMMPCHGYGHTQLIRLNVEGQLAVTEYCIDGDHENITLVSCSSRVADGPWSYYESTHFLIHRPKKLCLVQQPATHRLFLRPCHKNNNYHKWIFQSLRPWW
ncbi:N-acetylgalactosaminyltransferase 7 [Gryllus bimaculatus]|nr:N-acetylgalactosaminyltransferase 7 [Gryllus bimaculatus]